MGEEFYCADLVGLEAVTREGARLGRVSSVSNYGAGDILEIAPDGGGETLLLPFTRAVAPVIDFDRGRDRDRAARADRRLSPEPRIGRIDFFSAAPQKVARPSFPPSFEGG